MGLVRTIAGTGAEERRGVARAVLLLVLVICVAGTALLSRRSAEPPFLAQPSAQASVPQEEVARIAQPEALAIQSREEIGPAQQPLPANALLFPFERKRSTLVVVLVADGKPAGAGSVRVSDPFSDGVQSPDWRSVDPATGSATFPDLAVGAYSLWIEDLPMGWVLPRALWDDPTRLSVNLPEEGETLRIELEQGLHVSGTVSLPDGKPVKNLTDVPWPEPSIAVWYYDESWKGYVRRETLAVRDGRYEGDVHAGLCVLTAERLLEARDVGAGMRILPPVPALRRMSAGSATNVDLRCREAGSARLAGAALDDRGQPFADLRLDLAQCFALVEPATGEALEWNLSDLGARVRTGADGSFQIDGLHPGRHALTIEAGNCSPLIPPDGAKIGQFDPPRSLQLAAGETRIELKLRRAQPVHVTGTLEIDSEWAAQHLAPGQYATLSLLYSTDLADDHERRLGLGYPKPDFAFWVESTLREPRLEAELAGEKLIVPLALDPSTDPARLVIHFPR